MAASSSSSAPKPSIGILSIGDMGMGFAKLLKSHEYSVFTVAAGRSQHTKDRIKAARIKDLDNDESLVIECDIILSIVPPRDAVATARRIHTACIKAAKERQERKGFANLLFIDLNAVSSRTARNIAHLIATGQAPPAPSLGRRLSRTLSMKSTEEPPAKPIEIHCLDGAILGGPPQMKSDKSWRMPSVVLSGIPDSNLTEALTQVMNAKVISDQIGTASTLKACFAGLNKGIQALAMATYTTALTAGVMPELQSHLEEFFPSVKALIDRGLPTTPPKAYRWVDEMKQIGETLADEGHLGPGHGGQATFEGIAELYKTMAEDTVLGKELTHKRKRGTTAEDVAAAVQEGLQEKRQRSDSDPKLELAWRSSWGV